MLDGLHMSGSMKALFPRPKDTGLDAVLLNTAGGITGGDKFDIQIGAQVGTTLTLTTQAAERIYRAQPGAPGRVETRLTAEAGAHMMWLPQETILFNGAALDRSLSIDAAADATVLACETLVFGRTTMGEHLDELTLRDRMDVRVDGKLVFADRLRLEGDAWRQLQRRAVANGAKAMASAVLAAPQAALHLAELREALADCGGASALSDNLIFIRMLAEDSFDLRQTLVPILIGLTDTEIPRTWTI